MPKGGRAFKRGQRMALSGDYHGACKAFQDAFDASANPAVLAHWALALSNLGESDQALEKILLATSNSPRNPAFRLIEALVHYDAGDPEMAEKSACMILNDYPDNVAASNVLALALFRSGEPGKGLELVLKEGTCGNLDIRARLLLELQLSLPDPVCLPEEPDDALQCAPGAAHGFRFLDRVRAKMALDRGIRLLRGGKNVEAYHALQYAMGIDPELPGIHFHLGAALYGLGRPEEAINLLATVEENDLHFYSAQFYIGVCRLCMGEMDQAEETLAAISGRTEIFDFQPYLDYFLGVILLLRNQKHEALISFRKSLSSWDPLLAELISEVQQYKKQGKWPHQIEHPPHPDLAEVDSSIGIIAMAPNRDKSDSAQQPEMNAHQEAEEKVDATPHQEEETNEAHQQTDQAQSTGEENSRNGQQQPEQLPGEESNQGQEPGQAQDHGEAKQEKQDGANNMEHDEKEESEGETPPAVESPETLSFSRSDLSPEEKELADSLEAQLTGPGASEGENTGPGEARPQVQAEEEKEQEPGKKWTRGLSALVPVPLKGIRCWEINDTPSERFFLLEDPRQNRYMRLDDPERFIWRQMDGRTSLGEIAERYYEAFQALGFERIAELYQKLYYAGFLTPASEPLPSMAGREIPEEEKFIQKLLAAARPLAFRDLGIRFCAPFFQCARRLGAGCLGSGIFMTLAVVLGTMSLLYFFFGLAFSSKGLEMRIIEINGYYSLALLVGYLANIGGSFVHTLARGIALLHYRCRIVRAGLALRLGLLGFFVDIRDAMRLSRKARIIVLFSGMAAEALLAGIAGLLALQMGSSILALGATVICLRLFAHASPFGPSTLYLMASEMPEMQCLREAAFTFFRPGEWVRIWSKEAWSHRDIAIAAYGLWCAAWLLLAARVAALLLRTEFAESIERFWALCLGRIHAITIDQALAILLMLLVLIPAIFFLAVSALYVVASCYRSLRQISWWKMPHALAGTFLVLALCVFLLQALPTTMSSRESMSALVAIAGSVIAIAVIFNSFQEAPRPIVSAVPAALILSAIASLLGMWGALLSDVIPTHAPIAILAGGALAALALLIAFALFVRSAPYPAAFTWFALSLGLTALAVAVLPHVPHLARPGHERFHPSAGWMAAFTSAAWFTITCAWAWWYQVRTLEPELPAYDRDESTDEMVVLNNAAAYMLQSFVCFAGRIAGLSFAGRMQRKLTSKAENEGISLRFNEARWPEFDLALAGESSESTDIEQAMEKLRFIVLVGCEDLLPVVGGEGMMRLMRAILVHLPWDERASALQNLLVDTRWSSALEPGSAVPKQERMELLRNTFLFRQFDEDELARIAAIVQSRTYPAGTNIVLQNEEGNEAFVIVRGEVEVIVEDEIGVKRMVALLGPGDFFGELALLDNAPRSATVRAAQKVELLVLERPVFQQFAAKHDAAFEKFRNAIDALRLIQKMPIFRELSPAELASLAARFHLETCDAGTNVCSQGEAGDRFYVIQEGVAEVIAKNTEGTETTVQTLGAGDYFGEIALLRDVPRTATVKAVEKLTLFVLDKEDFLRLVRKNPFARRTLGTEAHRRLADISRYSFA